MNALRQHWLLDEGVTFLNHGSFGACPRAVLARQQVLREQMEREPVRFFLREAPALLRDARSRLAELVGADAERLAFVPNATTAVNTVLRSLPLGPDDELLVTNHEYNACRNALDFVAEQRRCLVRVAEVPFPLKRPEEVRRALLDAVTPDTRLLLIDHVTSQTGLVLPVESIVRDLQGMGVDVLVDGAHAPGMLPLDLDGLGAAYYTGNCHKWLCAPKGAAFLYVRPDRAERVRPVIISHGANAPVDGRSRFRHEFDWIGTDDLSPYLAVPAAIEFLEQVVPGGLAEVRRRNRELALHARNLLCAALRIPPPAPDSMIGSLAAVPLPDAPALRPGGAFDLDPLQDALFHEHAIEVPVGPWPRQPSRVLRISAALYNEPAEYERLAGVLPDLLTRL